VSVYPSLLLGTQRAGTLFTATPVRVSSRSPFRLKNLFSCVCSFLFEFSEGALCRPPDQSGSSIEDPRATPLCAVAAPLPPFVPVFLHPFSKHARSSPRGAGVGSGVLPSPFILKLPQSGPIFLSSAARAPLFPTFGSRPEKFVFFFFGRDPRRTFLRLFRLCRPGITPHTHFFHRAQ